MVETKTLHFYTTGDNFTRLLQDFIDEGRFKTTYETLSDGGLPDSEIREFFIGNRIFIGDTRVEPDLALITSPTLATEAEINDKLYWAIVNCIHDDSYDEDDEREKFRLINVVLPSKRDQIDLRIKDGILQNLSFLYRLFPREELKQRIMPRVINDEIVAEGFSINPDPRSENILDGVILTTGDYVVCGRQEHNRLYPILYKLGLSDSSDWLNDTVTIHVSAGSISGSITRYLNRGWGPDDEKLGPNEYQLQTLMKYRRSIKEVYGEYDSIVETLREYTVTTEDFGGKYGNLTFLKKYYPEIKLPAFSKNSFRTDNLLFIRTSPKHSLPGLLNSKVVTADTCERDALSEVLDSFDRYMHVIKDNVFYYFYQELIPGRNGVAHYTRDGFSYAVSDQQGDVVLGKKTGMKLSAAEEKELKKTMKTLYDDLRKPIQVEFVFTDESELYVVQLRRLTNNYEYTIVSHRPKDVIAEGLTFSKGTVNEVRLDEILIVESDAPAEMLIGKKALIVKEKVEFSHMLALSKALKIPSIYGTGELPALPEIVDFQAFGKDGFICGKI